MATKAARAEAKVATVAAKAAAGAVLEVAPPAAAPAVTEDGEQTNKMKKATDKIVNEVHKMV
jgi:hypothetical protein